MNDKQTYFTTKSMLNKYHWLLDTRHQRANNYFTWQSFFILSRFIKQCQWPFETKNWSDKWSKRASLARILWDSHEIRPFSFYLSHTSKKTSVHSFKTRLPRLDIQTVKRCSTASAWWTLNLHERLEKLKAKLPKLSLIFNKKRTCQIVIAMKLIIYSLPMID